MYVEIQVGFLMSLGYLQGTHASRTQLSNRPEKKRFRFREGNIWFLISHFDKTFTGSVFSLYLESKMKGNYI